MHLRISSRSEGKGNERSIGEGNRSEGSAVRDNMNRSEWSSVRGGELVREGVQGVW